MASYQTLDRDEVTTADDPNRGMWYPTHHGRCGYWTDDRDKLGRVGSGIPACPVCGCVGMQTTMKEWNGGAVEFEKDHPHYVAFVASRKESCFNRRDGRWMDYYDAFVKAKEEGN